LTGALDRAAAQGHEEVVLLHDRGSGLRAVIALHDTSLGPAAGGTRMSPYPSLDAAVADALRLSRAMTFKAAMAEVPRGGGKAVILGDPARDKTRALLAVFARAVDRMGGRFHTGPDMGIDARDVAVLARTTRHVSHAGGGGLDTADLTAHGVFASIAAAAGVLGAEVRGLHVAVQGLGQVGFRLCRLLAAAGARLTVADVDPGRVDRATAELGAAAVAPQSIHEVEADVFSPNAMGGVIDETTVAGLRCRAVVGSANVPLAEDRHGDALHERGILYGPDYVVNAGGLLTILHETGVVDENGIRERVRAIGPRVAALWERSRREDVPPHRLADRIVEERLAAARAARTAEASR
jgi:leucine dehydrogenase